MHDVSVRVSVKFAYIINVTHVSVASSGCRCTTRDASGGCSRGGLASTRLVLLLWKEERLMRGCQPVQSSVGVFGLCAC